MDFRIRNATKRDAAGVVELVRQLAQWEGKSTQFNKRDYLRDGIGRARRFSTIVATHGKVLIGYAAYHDGYDLESATRGLYLIDLFVKEEWRGRSVGTALMKALAKKCISSGGRWISWHVSRKNAEAIRFYESMKAMKNDNLQYWIEPS